MELFINATIEYRELTIEQRRKTYENYLSDRASMNEDPLYESFEDYDNDQMDENFEFYIDTLKFAG